MGGDCQPPKPNLFWMDNLLQCLRAKSASTQVSFFLYFAVLKTSQSRWGLEAQSVGDHRRLSGEWAITRCFSLGLRFWEVQVSCSTVYDRMKASMSLSPAVFHDKLLMR